VIPLSPRLIRIVELEEPVVTKKMLKPTFEEDTYLQNKLDKTFFSYRKEEEL